MGRVPAKYVNWQGDLSFDEQQLREVFARFGGAAYQAQCVERQIAILLATTHNPQFMRGTPSDRDAFFETEFAKTLGRLVTTLGERATLESDLESRFSKAVELRNWLTHHYFWDRASGLGTSDGREEMIAELHEAANFLGALDDELTAVTEEWLDRSGISKEKIEAELAKYLPGQNA